jgi:2-keto-4-pentenoate hydratase
MTGALEDRDRYAAGVQVQLARLQEAIGAGMPRRGWKVGIDVPEILEAQGLRHPGVGWIREDRVLGSGAVFEPPADARLHVEAEICLRMAGTPPPGCGRDEAFAAIAAVAPALEIVNYARPTDELDAVIAHSMFHEACVVGEELPTSELPADLGREWPVLSIDAEPGPPARPHD